jgi:uncharacterized protein YacL
MWHGSGTKHIFSSTSSVNITRLCYLLVCGAAGFAIALSTKGSSIEVSAEMGLFGGMAVAGLFIFMESLMKSFTLRGFSTAIFGLGVGLLCAWLLTRVNIGHLLDLAFRERIIKEENIGEAKAEMIARTMRLAFDVTLFSSLGFFGAVLALRSNRDDFAFIVPYVRFRQDAISGQPVVLDIDAVIDGRIAAIYRTGFLYGRLIVPHFVLEELQRMGNSPVSITRQRGQRGLEGLQKMQAAPEIQISIHDSRTLVQDEAVPQRLIEVTRLLGARLFTANDNITKIAKLQNIDVINIFELDEALKPTVLVGDRVRITLVRGGKDEHQAVGYLPDGTMIVVNHSAGEIGKTVDVTVINTLNTIAGTMVFAELHQS